jgi:Rieske Fe-S protein
MGQWLGQVMATKKTAPAKTTGKGAKAPAKTVTKPATKTAAKTAKAPAKTATKPRAEAPKLKVKGTDPKTAATKRGEPYVAILSVELDPDNIGNGAFELDWNDIFVARLVKAGYEGKTDSAIVDRWFQTICRNVLQENFEQWAANQTDMARVIDRTDLGDGRTQVS